MYTQTRVLVALIYHGTLPKAARRGLPSSRVLTLPRYRALRPSRGGGPKMQSHIEYFTESETNVRITIIDWS